MNFRRAGRNLRETSWNLRETSGSFREAILGPRGGAVLKADQRFRDADRLRLLGHLAHEALAGWQRRRLEVGGHGVGHEIALEPGNFVVAEVAGLNVLASLAHAVFGQKLEGEEDEVVVGDMISGSQGHASSSFLRLKSALRMRVLTVPRGSPVISAISE